MSKRGGVGWLIDQAKYGDTDGFLRAANWAGEKAAPLVMVMKAGGDPMDDYKSIPAWAASAIKHACIKAFHGEIKSWDEVFGKPIPKGKQQRGIQTAAMKFEVHGRVMELKEAGHKIDNDLFDRVGKELRIGTVGRATTVKKLYGEVKRLRAAALQERKDKFDRSNSS
jgi:hypothetical protein